MNILIIPEDFRYDQYILEPIIRAMFEDLGKPTVKVRVCRDPLLGGIVPATNWERIKEILDRYKGMVDIFLLCVDRDGQEGRRQTLNNLEQAALDYLPDGKLFLAENAWQEIEVWVLAGHTLPKKWKWKAVHTDINPKENYFMPFAEQQGLLYEPGNGRKTLAIAAARQYKRIRKLCPEDILNLETRIQAWLSSK